MGSYPPRECGIATFTRDLTKAIDKRFSPSIKSKILALNTDVTSTYNYSDDVVYQINDIVIQDYIDCAKEINSNPNIKLICIQHEFGLFGSKYGDFIIPFLEILTKPVVVNFHTVLPNPDNRLKNVVKSICDKVVCVIVMAKKGIEILKQDYGITADILRIPHGIPHVQFSTSDKEKTKLGFANRTILSSFGMMNSSKGYEYVIESLPAVVKEFPDTLYLIIGETHPLIRKKHGEAYRTFLEDKVKKLGLQNHVKFYNKYLTLVEIVKYLEATDIYVSANQNPDQIVSGTLSYAMGSGRPVISTPYLHAAELITSSRGLLAKFNDSESFSSAILKLLSDNTLRSELQQNCYTFTRPMLWNNVALSYVNLFKKYIGEYNKFEREIPRVKLSHLSTLTDKFGVIQFANHTVPDISTGYTLDDNARALIVAGMHYDNFKDQSKLKLIQTYLNFIQYVQEQDGRLLNIVLGDKQLDYNSFSDDAHGRALWSLGYIISLPSIPIELRLKAEQIFNKALFSVPTASAPRAAAFTIIGIHYYNLTHPSSDKLMKLRELADYLTSLFEKYSKDSWAWFEDNLTYSNSKLPESLFYAYLTLKDEKYLRVAKATIDFLMSITYENGTFSPIGQNGWYIQGKTKAHFDQQPLDTAAMVQTLLLAHKVLNDDIYLQKAQVAFQWFLGNNFLNQMIYDENTGGCHDGIGEFSINLNQGAESTIAYLLARLSVLEQRDFKPNVTSL